MKSAQVKMARQLGDGASYCTLLKKPGVCSYYHAAARKSAMGHRKCPDYSSHRTRTTHQFAFANLQIFEELHQVADSSICAEDCFLELS